MFGLRKKKVKQQEIIAGLVSLHQAYEGIFILGAIGAGKTSGPGKEIALNLLASGAGGLVLSAKREYPRWAEMGKRTGREIIRWGPGCGWHYPFLECELRRGGIMAAEALMGDILQGTGQQLNKSSDPFWYVSAQRMTRNCIAGVWLGTGKCSVGGVVDYMHSLPNSPDQLKDAEWEQNATCCKCLKAARDKGLEKHPDYELAYAFIKECAYMADKMFTSIKAQAMCCFDPFLTSEVRPLIDGAEGTVPRSIPDLVLDGNVVVNDTPVLTMREPGRMCNLVAKLGLQRSILARPVTPDMRAVFLFSDEANWFAVQGIDALAQSVARESKFINVVMCQNIPLLQKQLGGDQANTDISGWTANFQTVIACQNNCPHTNHWMSNLIGTSLQIMISGGAGHQYDPVSDWMGKDQAHVHWNEQRLPKVQPDEFTRLKKGTESSGFQVEAIVYCGGMTLPSGDTWMKTTFDQRI